MTHPRIIQIPLPGGSGRMPTGAMQFENDWPGLFIRGDDALFLSARIRLLAERLAESKDVEIMSLIFSLRQFADVIDRDVKVHPEKPA